jgi:NADH:ubiquinone oxidoreductase subunit H
VLAGYASNSKYSFLGGIRSSAQMISYEIAMGMSVIPVFLLVGGLNLSKVIEYQAAHGWLVFYAPLSFVIFLIAAFAETNRLPFDLPESEQELIGGYHTEYSSMKFALFFLSEYANMIASSAMMVTLFFGGWDIPGQWDRIWFSNIINLDDIMFKCCQSSICPPPSGAGPSGNVFNYAIIKNGFVGIQCDTFSAPHVPAVILNRTWPFTSWA